MKILLAAINAKYIHSNPAVYSLQRYVREHGERVELREYTINQPTDEILGSIFEEAPQVICFSCYIWNIALIRELSRELKKLLPHTDIWLGGPEVSFDAVQELEQMEDISGIMEGEGEATFLELVRYYRESRGEPEKIAGITFRSAAGRIVKNPSRPLLDLGRIPFPYEELQDFAHRIIYYESSRGCPFSCSYCLSSVDKTLRFRPLELVLRELDIFLAQQVQQVKFVDRTFNCDRRHARAIWKHLLEHDNGVTNFHFEIGADLLEEEDLRLLAGMRPGLVQLEIGVQSVNAKTLQEIQRNMSFAEIAAAVRAIQRGGNIHQHLDLIAGLPYEDYQSFAQSFDRVYALRPQQLQLGFLKVLKGSPMWERSRQYGCAYHEQPPYEVLFTDWLSYREVLRLKQVEEMVEVYYNSGQFTHTMEQLVALFASPFACYEALALFYQEQGCRQLSHSRMRRYELLREFVGGRFPEELVRLEEYLTLDYYLRENAKSRPAWCPEPLAGTEQRALCEGLYETLLAHYQGYEPRQIRRMIHMEYFSGDVWKQGSDTGYVLLFDYQKRDPLTGEATVYPLERREEQELCRRS